MTLELQTLPREANTKASAVREAGNIPAIIYGGGKDTVAVAVEEAGFKKIFREAGESTVIQLQTGKDTEQALIQDVQVDPVSGKILHVDFKAVVAGESITVTVPLEFVGESPAVKSNLGTLTKAIQEVEIEVLPKDLPSELPVDLSQLAALEDQILVKDIPLPAGVTVLNDADEVVAVISVAKEEVEEAPEEIDFSQIEVEQKGKSEEEGEEAPAE